MSITTSKEILINTAKMLVEGWTAQMELIIDEKERLALQKLIDETNGFILRLTKKDY